MNKILRSVSADYESSPLRAVVLYAFWSIALVEAVSVAYRWLFPNGSICLGDAIQLQLSSLDQAPLDRFAESCDLAAVRDTLGRDAILTALSMAGLALFFVVWWARSWDVPHAKMRPVGLALAAVAGVTAVVTVVANLITRNNLDQMAAGNYRLDLASAVATLSWIRWLLTAVVLGAFAATALTWLIRAVSQLYRTVFDRDGNGAQKLRSTTWSPKGREPEFGICLSGGGIRSAAFSLGALSALEEATVAEPKENASAGLLGQADVISSVSGGGYASSAWRIAIGHESNENSQQAIIGDPNDCNVEYRSRGFQLKSTPDQATHKLIERLVARRRYLSSGRGGLVVTGAWVIIQLVWHFALLLVPIGLAAWPIGRLVASPIITSDGGVIDYGRLSRPGLLLLALVAVVIVFRSLTKPGTLQTVANYSIVALAALAAGLLTLLVVLPWLTTSLIGDLSAGRGSAAATLLTGGVVATVWRVVQAPLKTYAAYLGGVLLIVGLIIFGGFVSAHAASGDGVFSGSWQWWFSVAAAYLFVLAVANPDLWSLHPIYCRRLGSTFANRRSEAGWVGLGPVSKQRPLSAYADAPGPKPLICAVAARMGRSNTGVPVVSMTFEPDYVTVHQGPEAGSRAIRTEDYERIFSGRVGGRRLQSVMGLASVSAAAVAPSLGKMSLGSTNALIAALNLRLGVWMPNPLYDRGRHASTDMFSMFKEMIGRFDHDDPNLYVTDGGHWENLGLVELIRRRTRSIIAVDASADPPYTFKSLMEAIELALLECDAKIKFLPGELEAMRPISPADAPEQWTDGAPRPLKNWAKATITYGDGSTGRLLFVKSQASKALPLEILRYSKEDPNFPNYSTANQFLSEAEFANLSILGRQSMILALQQQKQSPWLFGSDEEPRTAAAGDDGPLEPGVQLATQSTIVVTNVPEPRAGHSEYSLNLAVEGTQGGADSEYGAGYLDLDDGEPGEPDQPGQENNPSAMPSAT